MGKRKRPILEDIEVLKKVCQSHGLSSHVDQMSKSSVTLQIITGSYERELHGIAVSISQNEEGQYDSKSRVIFSDTFLFNAHSSAIKCLAISPLWSKDGSPSPKVILASGGTDERINLYHLSTSNIDNEDQKRPSVSTLAGMKILENPKNRELGSLVHHSSSVTALYFTSQSKLLSAGEDNTIAVTRTRDWTMLSTIKAPIPKAVGRPSGDTAGPGDAPSGINDFAIHPSKKLMISVGKGEKCMRLWNLITGKKAGVLTFERNFLQKVGEGKWSSGEGRTVKWNVEGDEFVVGFERGAVVFGMDSKPKYYILPSQRTKIHRIRYIPLRQAQSSGSRLDMLAVSTEDGRILFYSSTASKLSETDESQSNQENGLREPICQLGGKQSGLTGRIKDFEVMEIPTTRPTSICFIVITASSDGSIRLWSLTENELNMDNDLTASTHLSKEVDNIISSKIELEPQPHQVGRLLGLYESGRRITCLQAFIMPDVSKKTAEEQNSEASQKLSGTEEIGGEVGNGNQKN